MLPKPIQEALGCLDMTLEDELALFRHQNNAKLLALSASERSPVEPTPAPLSLAEGDVTVLQGELAAEPDLEAEAPDVVYAEANPTPAPLSLAEGDVTVLQGELAAEPDLEAEAPDVVYAELETEPEAGVPIYPDEDLPEPPPGDRSVSPIQAPSPEQGATQELAADLSSPEPDEEPAPSESPQPTAVSRKGAQVSSSEPPSPLPAPYGSEANPMPDSFEKFLDPSINDYLESSAGLLKHMDSAPPDSEQRVQQSTQKSLKIAGLVGLGFGIVLSGIWVLMTLFKPTAGQLETPDSAVSPTPSQETSPSAPVPPTAVPSPSGTVPNALSPQSPGISPPSTLPGGTSTPAIPPESGGEAPESIPPSSGSPTINNAISPTGAPEQPAGENNVPQQ